MKEYGLEIPKIETNGFFTIRFNRPTAKIKEEMSVKNVGKVSVKNVGKKERKKKILKKIKIREPFTLITLAKEFGVSEKTIERDINELKDAGIIRFVGSKRTGRYEIIFGIKHQQDVQN